LRGSSKQLSPSATTRLSTPKTEKGRRSIELDAYTVSALREHKKRQLEERLAYGPGYAENDLAFRQPDGSAITPHLFSLAFMTRARQAGLPKIRLHDLRHTHATLALKAGEPAKVVSERLGHSSVAITLDIYSHADPGLQKGTAERVAALVLRD
jgi:integrase